MNSCDIIKDDDHQDLTKALEDYLKVIYKIEEEHGSAAVSDIADIIGVKNPSVTFALQRLDKLGLVNYRRYRTVTLTEDGKKIAESLQCVHKTLKEFFLLIKVDKNIADIDACQIEHIAHNQTVRRLTQFLEFVKKEPKCKKIFEKFEQSLDSHA